MSGKKRMRFSTAENVINGGSVSKAGSSSSSYRHRSGGAAKYQKMSKVNFAKLAKQVKAISSKVKPQVNNYKWKSSPAGTIATASVTNSTPQILLLNGLGEGTDEVNRIGDLCRMLQLDLNFHVQNASTSATPAVVRILVVQEKTALGGGLQMASLFNSATPQPWDVRNVTTKDNSRYVVYHDETFILGPAVVQAAGGTAAVYSGSTPMEQMFSIKKKLNFITDYSRGNAGTVADIDTNSLFFVTITDNVTAAAVNVDLAWNLCFLD